MMLRNLFAEIVRRRLWPIVALAALVAVAAPLLFLRSAPPDAPLASALAPQTAPAGKLPARAQQLLAAADDDEQGVRKAKGRAGDPFRAPSSHAARSADGAPGDSAKNAGPAAGTPTEPVPVVITNADGTTPATSTTTTPGTTSDAAPIGDGATTTTVAKRAIAVDVRFGRTHPGRLHRAIPRLQTFVAGGRVVAIFVKYSPKRDKAVFAIAPSTLVTGDIDCRRKGDVCRYVDIPAGKSVRLTTLGSDGSLVTRRLDVVRIGTASSGATAAAASSAPANGSCLLGKLLTLSRQNSPLASDACKS